MSNMDTIFFYFAYNSDKKAVLNWTAWWHLACTWTCAPFYLIYCAIFTIFNCTFLHQFLFFEQDHFAVYGQHAPYGELALFTWFEGEADGLLFEVVESRWVVQDGEGPCFGQEFVEAEGAVFVCDGVEGLAAVFDHDGDATPARFFHEVEFAIGGTIPIGRAVSAIPIPILYSVAIFKKALFLGPKDGDSASQRGCFDNFDIDVLFLVFFDGDGERYF